MKTVLITGANKGIGFETAKQLAKLNYFVYLGSREIKNGIEAINKLKNMGVSNVEALQIDVSNKASVVQARRELETKLEALDVLINNAGITGEQPQNISSCDIENYRKVFDTNYFGAIQTTQQFIPLLRKSKLPIIVNVSSEIGSLAMHTSKGRNPNWDFYNAYGSSKMALNTFTIMLSNEFRETNFKINSVTPGFTATDLNDHKGIKTVEEGARPIVKCATLDKDGPTGRFFKEEGEVQW
jgi:NAD(P)-dependent dehydrogenase (short-subunit alcohol dehydrogenase family)